MRLPCQSEKPCAASATRVCGDTFHTPSTCTFPLSPSCRRSLRFRHHHQFWPKRPHSTMNHPRHLRCRWNHRSTMKLRHLRKWPRDYARRKTYCCKCGEISQQQHRWCKPSLPSFLPSPLAPKLFRPSSFVFLGLGLGFRAKPFIVRATLAPNFAVLPFRIKYIWSLIKNKYCSFKSKIRNFVANWRANFLNYTK